jgi:hypothetical protein
MTLLDALRPSATDTERSPRTRAPWAVGAFVAAAGLLGAVSVAVIGWATAMPRGTGLGRVAGFGADLWLLSHGARLGVDSGHIALSPPALTALLLSGARRGALRVLRDLRHDGPLWRGVIETGRAQALGRFLGGYVVVGVIGYALTFLVDIRPTWLSIVPALLGIPLLGVVLALARHVVEADEASWWAGLGVPLWLRRATPAAVRGLRLTVGVGILVVLLGLVVHAGRVGHVTSEVGAGGLGVLMLWLGQGMFLPDLGIWGLSLLAGPGYTLAEGSTVTLGGATGSVLPLIPVYAASPQPGGFPGFAVLVVLLPVLLGTRIGLWALASVPRLSRTRTKLGVAAGAGCVTALLVGALDAFAGGSLGAFRLSDIGAPAHWLVVALAFELVAGALMAVLWDTWRLHTR